MLAVFVKAVIVGFVVFQEDDAFGMLIAKKGDGFVRFLLQIAETDDVAVGFDRIKNAVGAGEGLQQPMLLQFLIHPEGVKGCGVKACQKHVDDNQ